MNSFISFFPALNGDSILIKIEEYAMLIDGGYVNTFTKYIKPDLEAIQAELGSLGLIVVTHIDKDHISGIIKLIEENNNAPFIKVDDIWHNSFKHIKQYHPGITFEGKSVKTMDVKFSLQEEQAEGSKDVSAVQGSTLASALFKGTYNWNAAFDGQAVSVANKTIVQLTDTVILKLLSPTTEKLSNLNLSWKKELYQRGYATTEDLEGFSEVAFESIVAELKEQKKIKEKNIAATEMELDVLANAPFFEDNGVANGSSIAFVIEAFDKKYLFLGDAHPTTIVDNLKAQYKKNDFPIPFELVKISHHGSQKNTSLELLGTIAAKRYIFCTNGRTNQHPDSETVARIITQKTPYTKELYFNYPLESMEAFKDGQLMDKYNYRIHEGTGLEPLKIDL